MILQAPGDAPTCSILLPDPALANERGQVLSVNHRISRDGSQYTYVRKSDDKILNYELENVGRGKLVELQEFIKQFQGDVFRLEDHRGTVWRVHLTPETFETVMNARAANVFETGNISLSFTGQPYA